MKPRCGGEEFNVRWRRGGRASGAAWHGDAVAAESGHAVGDVRRGVGGGEGGEGTGAAAVEPAGDAGVHSDTRGAGEGLHCVEAEQDALGSSEFEDEGERVQEEP